VNIYTTNGKYNFPPEQSFTIRVDASDSTGLSAIILYRYYSGQMQQIDSINCGGSTICTLFHTRSEWNAGTYYYYGYAFDIWGNYVYNYITVNIQQQNPIANAGGPYSGNEGSPITLDGSGSFDPDGTIVLYEWDLDNDGSYDDATGVNPVYTWNDDYSGIIGLRVTDNYGGTGTATTTATINNVAPVAGASNNGPVNEGSPATITASQTDPGADIFTYSFDWDNDGVYEVVDQANPSANYIWNDNGTYTVGVRVRDDDGGIGTTITVVVVNDLGPTAVLTGNTLLEKNQTGNYNASGSTSYPDAIVSYEWDWNYTGIFNASGDTGAIQTHSWDNYGNYTVGVSVRDDDGSASIATLLVTVTDLTPPTLLQFIPPTPVDNANLSVTSVIVNVSHVEPNPDTLILNWNGTNQSQGYSGEYTSINKSVVDGVYTYYVWINDTVGNSNQTETRTLIIDTVMPTTSDNYTLNNTWVNQNQTIGLIPLDPAPSSGIKWTRYCQVQDCDPVAGTDYTTPVNIGSEGTNYFRYASRDFANNTQMIRELWIKIDKTQPVVDVVYPENITYNTTMLNLNYTVYDNIAVNSVWYQYNNTNTTITGNTSFTALDNQQSMLVLWVNDSAGNINFDSVIFTVDTLSPALIFVPPTLPNQSVTGNNWVYINVSSNENLSMCLLDWNAMNESMVVNGNYCYINKTNLTDNSYYFRIWGNDSLGNLNVTEDREIIVDTTPPYITIHSPQNITYNYVNIQLNVSVSEPVNTWWYSLNNGVNTTFTPNTSITGAEGQNNLIVYANDSVGNLNSSMVYFTVDTPPTLIFIPPTLANNSYTSQNWIYINVSSSENVSECLLEFNLTNQTMNKVNANENTYCYINKTNLTDGSYYFRVYANDTIGNLNMTNRKITIDKIPPTIEFILPTPVNDSSQTSKTVVINVSHIESNPDTLILNWNGANQSQSYSGSYTGMTMSGLSDGVYTYYIWIRDKAGNSNQTETRTVRIYTAPVTFSLGGRGYTPTCWDRIQNQNETGIDCGGPCEPCPTCSDGIRNQGEEGIDCGGPCEPCPAYPSCSDGIQNQGEEGIDCGGPCEPCMLGINISIQPINCSDGIQNQGEEGIDCGGPCEPCPTCWDRIQNQNETGIDCGGPCEPCPFDITGLIIANSGIIVGIAAVIILTILYYLFYKKRHKLLKVYNVQITLSSFSLKSLSSLSISFFIASK
jgi:hypothetical protein